MRISTTAVALVAAIFCAVKTSATATATADGQTQSNLRKLQSNNQIPLGFQSGPDPGPSYGGSIVYRPDTKRIYVTGSTYGNYFQSATLNTNNDQGSEQSSCFLGIAQFPSANNAETPMTWIHAQQWETTVPEACNAIQVDFNPNNLPENNTDIQEKMYLL